MAPLLTTIIWPKWHTQTHTSFQLCIFIGMLSLSAGPANYISNLAAAHWTTDVKLQRNSAKNLHYFYSAQSSGCTNAHTLLPHFGVCLDESWYACSVQIYWYWPHIFLHNWHYSGKTSSMFAVYLFSSADITENRTFMSVFCHAIS